MPPARGYPVSNMTEAAPVQGNRLRSEQGSGASKYGLNGSMTTIVRDRGEKDYRRDFGRSQADSPQISQKPMAIEALANTLARRRKHSFDRPHAFIPRHVLEATMSFDQVMEIVRQLQCFQGQDSAMLARRICFGSDAERPCRKLLGALIGMRLGDLIKCAMDDGMDDDCLPLMSQSGNLDQFLICQIDGHQHSGFNNGLVNIDDRSRLITWTHALTAPYIKQMEDMHFHYVLEHEDHLPMQTSGQVMENMETNEVTVVPTGPNGDTGAFMAHGGFGKVFQVQIEPSHWNFGGGDTGLRNPRKLFALKQLNDNDFNVFEMELKSLLYCLHHKFVDEELLKEGQKHMTHVRASFAVHNATKNQTDYYLLFDWQDGNLSQFWQSKEELRADKDHPRWMAQQIFGLAAALQCVHNDRSAHQSQSRTRNIHTVYGRHGDLGPSNILYSKTEDGRGYELKLTDFGLAQLHSRMSRSIGNPAKTERTETYKGPEFDMIDGQISRATDIFSFGAVVLEYITWYLLGYDKVKEFADKRLEPEAHRSGFHTDTYFSIILKPDGTQHSALKAQVLEQINVLNKHERCSWYLHDMLDLIKESMLNPDPAQRMSSSQLTRRLDALRKACEVDVTYYTGYWDSVSPKATWRNHDL